MKRTSRRPILLCVITAAALVISACSGGGHSVPTPITGTGSTFSGPAPARGSTNITYGETQLSGATYLGPVKVGTIGLDLFLTMRDQAGLQRYAADASDSSSPVYRQWLTPQQLGDRFGASQADYDSAVSSLNNLGIATKSYPQRQMIRVHGPQRSLEAALGTTFGLYSKHGQTFIAPATAPHPNASLHATAMTGLVGYTTRHRNFVPIRIANGYTPGLSPQQIANVFDYTGAYNAGYKGAGIKIGIIGTGPIADGDARISGGAGGDVAAYRFAYGVSGGGIVQQVFGTDANVSPGCSTCSPGNQYSTGLSSPPPVTGPCVDVLPDCNPEDIEAQIDTEQASGLAPDATVLFYIAYNGNECFTTGPCAPGTGFGPEEGIALTDDEIQQAIGDNQADVISMSFGLSEMNAEGYWFDSNGNGFGTTEDASLVSEGMAVFVSSGDQGAEECRPNNGNPGAFTPVVNTLCVSSPSSDPSVVSVGGTNTPLDSSGRLSNVLTGWTSSGGGCSIIFAVPSYQSSNVTGLPCAKRAQPDVSLDADTSSGVAVFIDSAPGLGGRQVEPFGGTSVAAPEMAAMWALVLQACKQTPACNTGPSGHTYRLGNPNPLLYKIYKGTGGLPYANVFYDVQFGNNPEPYATPHAGPSSTPFPSFAPGFDSGVGYDLVTGIGAPFARHLIKAIVGV